MKKSKENGFMLLETLIVSSIILSALVFLFIQFTTIKTSYEVSFRYNTIPGIYHTKEITHYFSENGYTTLAEYLDGEQNTTGYMNITTQTSYFEIGSNTSLYHNLIHDINVRTVLFVNDDLARLKEYLTNTTDDLSGVFSEELKQYIFKLATTETNDYRIIVEFNDGTYASITI